MRIEDGHLAAQLLRQPHVVDIEESDIFAGRVLQSTFRDAA
jgi:hypothetical protein